MSPPPNPAGAFQVPVQPIEPPSLDTQYSTIHKSPSRRKSRAGAGMARSVPGTLDRRGNHDMTMDSCDTMDMPLTPASFAGLDHKVGRRKEGRREGGK